LYDPNIPFSLSKLKSQNEYTGPKSNTQSYKWPYKCILGVTKSCPYSCSNFLQNSINNLSATLALFTVIKTEHSLLHAKARDVLM
jgi:hypothetical protein